MNNDNLNLQANNEGKCNAAGCRRINYNELYEKSIKIEMKCNMWVKLKNQALPKLSIDMTYLRT